MASAILIVIPIDWLNAGTGILIGLARSCVSRGVAAREGKIMKYRDLRVGTLLGAAVAGPSMVSGAAGAQDFSALTTCCWHNAARPARTCERKKRN
jgi:hypothetical protein